CGPRTREEWCSLATKSSPPSSRSSRSSPGSFPTGCHERTVPSLRFLPLVSPGFRVALLGRLAALAATDNQPLRRLLLVSGLLTLLLAPRAHHVTTAARTATVRGVHRVHGLGSNLRPASHPAALPGLAPWQQLGLGVANPSNRGRAGCVNPAHFGGSHAQRHVV